MYRPSTPRHITPISMLLGLIIIVALLNWPLSTQAQQDDVASTPVGDTVPTEPPPSPTLVPTRPPTEQPSVTPTVAFTPSPEPTATATATSPSPATPNATEPPAPTVVPTPTATPTMPPVTPPSAISPLVATGTGCTQTSATDVVDATRIVSFSCEARTAALAQYYSGSISAPTTGWQYRVNGGPWQNGTSTVPTQATALGRSIPAFTIDLRPTGSVTPGTSGSITVSVFSQYCLGDLCGNPISSYSATLRGTRLAANPAASDVKVTCSPGTFSSPVTQTQVVDCTYSAQATLGVRQVTLTELVIPMPTGWSISSTTGTVAGSTLTIRPNAVIAYSETVPRSYAFSFTVSPSCNATTTSQPVAISSRFQSGTTENITGASYTAQVARSLPSPLAVSTQHNSLVWDESFSLTSSTLNGSLRYRVTTEGCSGWSIQIAASSFAYSGPNNGSTIPASNLQLTTSSQPTTITGSGTGVATTSASGPMAAPYKVLSASTGSGIGVFEQELGFQLTIPARALAGTYTSTITITSTAAP